MTVKLKQFWEAPKSLKPVVLIGAGGIARDAHLPAYKKAGFQVEGITDKEKLKAEQIAADWGIGSVYESHREAAKTWGTDAVYDIATPPQAILTTRLQKGWVSGGGDN